MTESSAHRLEAVAAFYDNVAAVRVLIGDSIHFGYWPNGQEDLSLAQAQDQLTDRVAAASGLREGQRLLDVGCGIGAPGRLIVRNIGASVMGVSISAKQVETATATSRKEGLGHRADYRVADAADLPFSDESFHAAIAIESILHMGDKLQALREIWRVLRPGSLLVIADLAAREMPEIPAGSDAEAFESSIMTILNQESYGPLANEAGFHVKDISDITAHTRPSYTRFLQRLNANRAELAALSSPEQVIGLDASIRFNSAATDAGNLGYIVVALRKPTA